MINNELHKYLETNECWTLKGFVRRIRKLGNCTLSDIESVNNSIFAVVRLGYDFKITNVTVRENKIIFITKVRKDDGNLTEVKYTYLFNKEEKTFDVVI